MDPGCVTSRRRAHVAARCYRCTTIVATIFLQNVQKPPKRSIGGHESGVLLGGHVIPQEGPCLRLGPLGARFASRTTAWLDSENSDPYAGGYSKERAPAHPEKSRSTWLRLPITT